MNCGTRIAPVLGCCPIQNWPFRGADPRSACCFILACDSLFFCISNAISLSVRISGGVKYQVGRNAQGWIAATNSCVSLRTAPTVSTKLSLSIHKSEFFVLRVVLVFISRTRSFSRNEPRVLYRASRNRQRLLTGIWPYNGQHDIILGEVAVGVISEPSTSASLAL
jgi:hypothetical protein